MLKRIEINRGGQTAFIEAGKDRYDSVLSVIDPVQGLINFTKHVNTDYGYKHINKGGILAEKQKIKAICGISKHLGKSMYLYNPEYDDKIKTKDDLSDLYTTLKSLIPNPAHNMRNELSWLMIHIGNIFNDGSQGCPTIYPSLYKAFIDCFAINEKADVILTRSPNFVAPEFYQGY